ncbi:MAG: OsmC family protein [Bacteroidota bacterium]
MRVELKRLDKDFLFEATNAEGVSMRFDASPDIGGHNQGVRPMQTLIMAIGGCSAIDIILILRKQKQEIDDFRISIDAEREQGKEPALWQKAHVVFWLKGRIDRDKAQRAAELSMKKYCSVSATLEKAGAAITYEVHVNE